MGSQGVDKYAGVITSQLAVQVIHDSLRDFLGQRDDNEPTSGFASVGVENSNLEKYLEWRLQRSVQKANEAIYRHWQQYKVDTKAATTVICALLYDQLALIANVGDCRGYHHRSNSLQQITEDHTLINRLIKSGKISTEQASDYHPLRNVIWNALGTHDEVQQIDIFQRSLEIGDRLLLCSGSLSGVLDDAALKDYVSSNAPANLVARGLVDAAKEKGSDDISVVIAEVKPGTL